MRQRAQHWSFRRRIPKRYKHLFRKDDIEVALDTNNRLLAEQRSHSFNQVWEEYLQVLGKSTNQDEVIGQFQNIYALCKKYGFQYMPLHDLIKQTSPNEFLNRVYAAHRSEEDNTAKAILGGSKDQGIKMSQVEEEFLEHEAAHLKNYSENQIRKWKNPKKKAIRNFKKAVGDREIAQITRADILAFRQWWVSRISAEKLTANSANKDIAVIKKLVRSMSDNYGLNLSIEHLFRDILLKHEEKTRRAPFETNFIKRVLLTENWKGNEECKWLIYIMADTGCRVSELTGLESQDILLNEAIPHIKIRPNHIRNLKTPQSERDIPLVGSALYAFMQMEGPFKHYFGKPDLISTTLNKYARENDIFPSKNHSLYSLRHSFEDRLTSVEPPDKVQAAIMGHKYMRPRYGNGPSLDQKKSYLDKIAFKL